SARLFGNLAALVLQIAADVVTVAQQELDHLGRAREELPDVRAGLDVTEALAVGDDAAVVVDLDVAEADQARADAVGGERLALAHGRTRLKSTTHTHGFDFQFARSPLMLSHSVRNHFSGPPSTRNHGWRSMPSAMQSSRVIDC